MKSKLRMTLGTTLAAFLLLFSLLGYANTGEDDGGGEPEVQATPVADDVDEEVSTEEESAEGM